MNQSITWLNELSTREAAGEFLKCCGSKRWADAMTAARPFYTVDELLVKAGSVWWSLNDSDWLEAFRAHPKIGEQKAATLQSAEAQEWSAQEQSGVAHGSRQTISEIAQKNREYEEKFGFIFIVCATGKSSDEILAIINERMSNDPQTELRIAAEEQNRITRLRFEKLLNQ